MRLLRLTKTILHLLLSWIPQPKSGLCQQGVRQNEFWVGNQQCLLQYAYKTYPRTHFHTFVQIIYVLMHTLTALISYT